MKPAVYIKLSNERIAKTIPLPDVNGQLIVDVDVDDKWVGIELLDYEYVAVEGIIHPIAE